MTCNGPENCEACVIPEDDPDQELSQVCSRLQTFTNFPSHCPVSSSTLAQAGFYYTGDGDKVKCFSCRATLEGWQNGDSAVGRHRTVSPNCNFINDVNFLKNDMHSVLPNCSCRTRNCFAVAAAAAAQPTPDASPDLCTDYLIRSGQVVDLSGSLYPRNPAMCSEEARLRSFHNWPSYALITPEELASAGLYYTGIGDEVECFCCGGKLKNWEPCDHAWSEHRRHFPRCFFVLGHDVGNIGSVPNQSAGAVLDRSDIHNVNLPQNPPMADYENRIKTFVTWRYLVSKEQLAQAGFYSLGNGDNVACFHCGGGLQEWKADEDPWEQHAKWFPGCKYLIEEKGQEFVNNIHLTTVQDSAAEETEESSLIKDLSIEDKLRSLQEEKLCKICMDRTISVVLIPCGHLVACENCAEAVDKCPLCCAMIAKRQKIYMY